MRMSFGKYEGVWLHNVPRPYLIWLRATVPMGGLFAMSVEYVLAGGKAPVPLHEFVADQLGEASAPKEDDAGD